MNTRLSALLFLAALSGCSVFGGGGPDHITAQDLLDYSNDELCYEAEPDSLVEYAHESQTIITNEVARRGLDCTPRGRVAERFTVFYDSELCAMEILAPAYGPASIPFIESEIKRRSLVCDPQKTQLTVQAYLAKDQADATRTRQQVLIEAMRYPQTVNCSSYTSGSYTSTTCN